MDLPDGTVVGLYEYGDPSGSPVFAFHGTPSCGAGFNWTDEPAQARGQRVLAPDRPGIGTSGGPPLATVADYPGRIAALADALGIDRFAVLEPRKAELVKLRYFIGMTIEDAADTLGISAPTAKRDWPYARAWPFRAIGNAPR